MNDGSGGCTSATRFFYFVDFLKVFMKSLQLRLLIQSALLKLSKDLSFLWTLSIKRREDLMTSPYLLGLYNTDQYLL
jgi:hypothetical protein